MKKFLFLLISLSFTFTSCNKSDSMVEKARKEYRERLNADAKANGVKIKYTNEQIILSKKDIVVISFSVNGKENGRWFTMDMISVYGVDEYGNVGTFLSPQEEFNLLSSTLKSLKNSEFLENEKLRNIKSDEDVYRWVISHK